MIDRYSKGVLTVIAAALVVLVVQNAIRPSTAQDGLQRVAICDPTATGQCAHVRWNTMRGGSLSINQDSN
jgi:hypothetical protein